MLPNPGGRLDPSDVIGRDALIQEIWDTLGHQSVILVSERRMGKTCVIQKMMAEPRPDWVMVYRDVEDVRTPLGFAERVLDSALRHFPPGARFGVMLQHSVRSIGGLDADGRVKLPRLFQMDWKRVLGSVFDTVTRDQTKHVCFAWDEFPTMLHSIAQGCGEHEAMELLNLLRSHRSQNPYLHMIFTGSVGLHHVLSELKTAGAYSPVLNDMRAIELLVLEDEFALSLARDLLDGKGVRVGDINEAARFIASSLDGMPYYIHCLVADLPNGRDVEIADIDSAAAKCVTRADDPWNLCHYRERIPVYYGERADLTNAILDEIAAARDAVEVDRLCALVTGLRPGSTEDDVRALLRLLVLDHYLFTDGTLYRFKFSVVKRWWRAAHGLE